MKTIYFRIGEEIHPHVEDLVSKENIDKSFFKDIYDKAFCLIDEIIKQSGKEVKSKNADDIYINNIIAFVGERGSGKTSCMLTVYKTLERVGELRGDYSLEILRSFEKRSFYTLPLIDPSYFEEGSNILDIIIAKMFEKFQEEVGQPNNGRFNPNFLEEKRELVRQFQLVKESLDRISKSCAPSNDSLEDLVSMASSFNLRQNLYLLVQCYLKFFNKKFLVIAIDDIDHETKHAHKMVEQIRKYFFLPDVIILTAIKFSQLTDIIKQNYIKEYEKLDSGKRLSDSVENISGRYLSKLIPYNHRIFLPELQISDRQEIIIDDPDKGELNFNSIDEAVLRLIFSKTRIVFYNTIDRVNLIVPRNLRDLLNLLSFLYHMPDIEDDRGVLVYNRGQFRQYFTEIWCNEHLSADQYGFIRNLKEQNPAQFNKCIIDFLSSNDVGIEDGYKDVYAKTNRAYNVSLGDVNYVLDQVEIQRNKPEILNFVYAIKTLYSFFLYDLFDDMCSDDFVKNQESVFESKFEIIQGRGSAMLKKANKLAIYSDYERMIGGSLINIGQDLSNKRLYTGQADAPILALIYNVLIVYLRKDSDWQEKIEKLQTDCNDSLRDLFGELIDYINQNQPDGLVSLLNLWEFFMLTTSNSSPYLKYRSYRHCFYDTYMFLLNMNDDKNVIFDNLSVLFNIIKYYNLHRHYIYYSHSVKGQDEKAKKSNVFVFWDLIYEYKDKSLLGGILFDGQQEKDSIWRNKNIENIFIRNMELLDLLQDYLPSLYKNRKCNDLTDLKKFYRKLDSFDFYTYRKQLQEKQQLENKLEIEKKNFRILHTVTEFLDKMEKRTNDDIIKRFFFIIYNPPYLDKKDNS